MAQNGFKHIAVTMPEDEDEVIVAGLPNVQASGSDESADEGVGDGLDAYDGDDVSIALESGTDALSDGLTISEPDVLGDADGDVAAAQGIADRDGFDAFEASTPVSSEPAAVPARAQRASSPEKQGAARGGRDKSGYQQPTLEDLQGEPMSMTQKIVIIAAVVCIIGAIIYYFVCMR